MLTNLQRIGLGTVQLGLPYGIANQAGRPDMNEAQAILNYASTQGIDLLDTAAAYGESEQVIGKISTGSFKIVSKWGREPEQTLKQSLRDLNTTSLYGWMAHRPDLLLTNPGTWEVMKRQQEAGLVDKIGYSVYGPEELEQLLDKDMKPSIIQFPFNALDRRFVQSLKPLKEMGCEIHCRSAYLQGLFFMDPSELSDFFDPVKEWLREVKNTAPKKITLMAALIADVLSFKEIDRVIIGVEHHSQLMDLVESLSEVQMVELPAVPIVPDYIINPSQWPAKN